MIALDKIGVSYYVIVEEQEYRYYAQYIKPEQLLILDKTFQDNYETCDDLGNTKSKGPGPARNFAWEHSIKNGYDFHWVMDDNIRNFYRLHNNMKIRILDGSFFKLQEDFILRYENVAMGGPNYYMFAPRKTKVKPFNVNTRIYSCNFIRNDLPYRWRGRYNEDTILSLDMLKGGWCTIQFYAFLQHKMQTQTVKGGNNTDFYSKEGTLPKSKMLVKVHPDVSELVWKFKRWHHKVDYSQFKYNKLELKKDIDIHNNYNYRLINVGAQK
jgi:hypothetical protein